MIKKIMAKHASVCAATGERIAAGDIINYDFETRKATLLERRAGTAVTFFNKGKASTFYRNSNGRCIDAPCCGCCTI
jgi:hypothetical protein